MDQVGCGVDWDTHYRIIQYNNKGRKAGSVMGIGWGRGGPGEKERSSPNRRLMPPKQPTASGSRLG
jgi:hypothetical protein